ncbi:MAG: SDR family oxidoreductase [Acidianus hospitalis]
MVSGKTVVITGGTRGIGRAIAEKFFSAGNKVIVLYNSSDQEAEKMKERGFYVLKCDVSKKDQVIDTAKKVSEITKTVDILVNNAGIWYLIPFEEFDDEKYRRMLEINLNGAIYVTHAFLPLMKEKGGAIINIASNAGIGTTALGTTFYSITKAGIIILTRRLAYELGKYNIRVNAVAPGWVETDMTIGGKSEEEIEKLRQWFRERTMLHTTGKPEDIANIVYFLASDEARYITGQVIVADGGRIDYLTHGI